MQAKPRTRNDQSHKVLWKETGLPDNHIPPDTFLSSLTTNSNFRPYTYWPVVLLACAIAQHLTTISLFVAVFARLRETSLDPITLLWISIVGFLVGYTIWVAIGYQTTGTPVEFTSHLKALKSSILIFLALMSLSPVLRTLTAATSSDSIWALSAMLFVLNALLADYSAPMRDQPQERLTSVLSMNAAVSSSVVLASRLSTDIEVFSLTLFSIQAFALFPMLRRRVQTLPAAIQVFTTFSLAVLALFLTSTLSWRVAYVYATTMLFVTFLAPAVLVWAQKYKNEIRGPWDVAVPMVN